MSSAWQGSLKVMSLNAWGMPAAFGAKDKTARIKGIGEEIRKAKYDIYLLNEVWMRPDHKVIKNLLPPNYHMTTVKNFNKRDKAAVNMIISVIKYLKKNSNLKWIKEENIATGETSQAITPFHFFDNFNFHHKITFTNG